MSTTTASAPAEAVVAASAATALSEPGLSGLRRLHPVDGLFLRAEHLDQIQQYAGELTRLSGLAGGSGTVYGFELDLEANEKSGEVRLQATAGLAVSAEGRLLRSVASLEVDLSGLERGVGGRVWLVEVVPAAAVLSGHEPAYTSVCATSCGPGSSIQPWVDDAVMVRVRAVTLEGSWPNAGVSQRRNAVAGDWFERERRRGDPWLTPTAPQTEVPSLLGRSWATPTPARPPDAQAVPLGLLHDVDGWGLDVWAARRDRMETPPQAAWQGHLSMRPWSVFTAQVLQFEAEVARLDVEDLLSDYLVQLPPGGFVEMPLRDGQKGSVDEWVLDRFGYAVDVSVHECQADVAVRAVAMAQHLDRIPLNVEPHAHIDVWVPSVPADLRELEAERYGWVAFTRGQPQRSRFGELRRSAVGLMESRGESVAATAVGDTDAVAVFVWDAPAQRNRYLSRIVGDAEAEPVAEVHFRPGGWGLVKDIDAFAVIHDRAGADSQIEMVASSAAASREPLMVARALALAGELRLTDGVQTAVYGAHVDAPDAIHVMVRSRV